MLALLNRKMNTLRESDDQAFIIHSSWNFNVLNSLNNLRIVQLKRWLMNPDILQFSPKRWLLIDVLLFEMHLKVDQKERENDY